jgi:hypothetical protein
MPDELSSRLDLYGARLVTILAAYHKATSGGTGKAALVAALAKTLADPAHIRAQWSSLSPGQRALAEAILRRGNRASLRTLREDLDRQGIIDKSRSPAADSYGRVKAADPNTRTSRRFEDLLAGLMLRGLVFAAGPAENPYPDSPGFEPPKIDFDHLPPAVLVPEAVRRHLPAVPLLAGPQNLRPVAAAPALAGSARTFQRDLYLYWSYVRDHTVYVTQKDEVQKTDLKKLNATLLVRETLGKGEGELDHLRLRFLRQMLIALNLLTFNDSSSLAPLPGAADFFALTPAARVQRTFEVWRQTDAFNELLLVLCTMPREVRPARPEQGLLMAHPLVVQARQTVLRALAVVCAPNAAEAWLPLEGLCAWLREDDYEFLLARSARRIGLNTYAPAPPYSAGANPLGVEFPGVRTEAEGWDQIEANFIRGVVTGPLSWLGLVDLGAVLQNDATGTVKSNGAAQPAPADAFCLTPMGRWLLGLGPRPEIPDGGGRVIVQPNLHIVALDPVNDALLVALDAFAERLNAERAVEYRLTRASVYAGQQAGWSAERIRAFLSEHTGADLPGNVARTLEEWQAQHERIVLRPAVTLAHGPAAVFDALAANPAAADLLAARPLPEVILLKDHTAVADLVSVLRERGLLPLVAATPAVPPNSIQADETGTLRFATPRPSLYLHGHLAAFADPADAAEGARGAGKAAYQLSPDTMARALRAGLTANDIIARLEGVHRGPVPAPLLRRIRAWARHFGDAALEPFVLLQVRDAATLAELRADPELAPLLHDFTPTPGKALAHVAPADLARLRALLAERGVELKETLE